jgi:hypothetical protein
MSPCRVCIGAPSTRERWWDSHPRRVSYMYNLAGVLNLNLLKILAARLLTFGGTGRV